MGAVHDQFLVPKPPAFLLSIHREMLERTLPIKGRFLLFYRVRATTMPKHRQPHSGRVCASIPTSCKSYCLIYIRVEHTTEFTKRSLLCCIVLPWQRSFGRNSALYWLDLLAFRCSTSSVRGIMRQAKKYRGARNGKYLLKQAALTFGLFQHCSCNSGVGFTVCPPQAPQS